MDEQIIADDLKQNIPKESTYTPPTPTPTVSDPAEATLHYDLDEITTYKLQQHFGETYNDKDMVAKQQLGFIYESVAERIGTKDYPFVIAKISEMKRMLGLNHNDNARHKLYEWLKLDQKRSRLESEMTSITNG